jgi:hypothetical protein
MYTRGEFLHMEKADLAAFLAEVAKRGMKLTAVSYYFRSRYYQLDPLP